MFRLIIIVSHLIPALALAQPASIVQTIPENVITVNQLLSIIAERDRQYNQRFEAQDKAVNLALSAQKELSQAALIAAKEAVQKAEVSSEKRFESVNEFRKTLSDQQITLMTRAESDVRFKEIERRLSEITSAISKRESEVKGAEALWGYIVGAIGIISVVGMALFNWSGRVHQKASA